MIDSKLNTYLVLGYGAREHAIVKSLLINTEAQVYCIGNRINPGIYSLIDKRCVRHDIMDFNFIKEYCIRYNIKVVIVGPEKPLAEGIVNYLQDICYCVGPKKELAKIESSKSWARRLLNSDEKLRNHSADYLEINNNSPESIDLNIEKCYNFIKKYNNQVVVKLDGLAGGKGVKVWGVHFNNLYELEMYLKELIISNTRFILEEKFIGKEFSVLSLTDGISFFHGKPIMDFKLLKNGDKGPNTGSMGSLMDYNGLHFLNSSDINTANLINEMVVDLLNSMDKKNSYNGVLYGSFMKTKSGIKVIEFNCRLGDPEGVLLLNNITTSFADISNWIVTKSLRRNLKNIKTKSTSSMCKYLVSQHYPKSIPGQFKINLSEYEKNIIYYGSGMIMDDDFEYMSNSSRGLLLLEEYQDNLEICEEIINLRINEILKDNYNFKLHYRTDFLERYNSAKEFINKMTPSTYLSSGVDIDSVTETLGNASSLIKSTHNKYVESDLTSFGGMFSLQYILDEKMKQPILVASTDGVGTKSSFVEKYFGSKGYRILGQDIVNHCINDILVQGAKPLFFLDYFASSKFPEKTFTHFLEGVTMSCNKYNCVLLGGETAEMPGIYKTGKCDVVGTIVGIVEKTKIINGRSIKQGDVVLAIQSSGLHTNGFSMVRSIYKDVDLPIDYVKKLSNPHRCYLNEITTLTDNSVEISGLCHITGGGLIDNPVRIMPETMKIRYTSDLIDNMPEIYHRLQKDGKIETRELMRIFNCGIGMMIIVDKRYQMQIKELIPEVFKIGEIVAK